MTTLNRNRMANAGFAFVALLWLGMLLGVSFLATPIKFHAASLDLATALDVGRVTFALFMKIEWALCLLLLATLIPAFYSRTQSGLRYAGSGLLVFLLVMQGVWLLPALDARVALILAGEAVAASAHHWVYIVIDFTKFCLLLGLSITALRDLARTEPGFNAYG